LGAAHHQIPSPCGGCREEETQAEQSKALVEKARELGADADKDDDAVIRRLAKQKRRDATGIAKPQNR
jgi:hypothetical protein